MFVEMVATRRKADDFALTSRELERFLAEATPPLLSIDITSPL